MKIKFALLVLVSLSLVGLATAKEIEFTPTERPKPRQRQKAESLRIKVEFGDQITYFNIAKTKKGGKIEFSNVAGAKDTKEITKEDFEYLLSKVASYPKGTNSLELCPRSYIEVRSSSRTIVSCLGAPHKLAREVQRTANLLSALF